MEGIIRQSLVSVFDLRDVHNIEADRQTDGNGVAIFSYYWGHGTSRKYDNSQSPNGLDYILSLRGESKNIFYLPNMNSDF